MSLPGKHEPVDVYFRADTMDIEGESVGMSSKTMSGSAEYVVEPSLRRRLLLAALTVLVFAFAVSSASAGLYHPLVGSFGGNETPAGNMFSFGVAVDNSSSASAGDVYVSERINKVVNKFSASGSYISQLTGPPSELFVGTFAQDAVNASGDLFVGDTAGHVVDEFDPSGAYLSQFQVPGEVWAVAVNSAAELLVAAGDTVYKYDPATSSLSTFASGTPGGGFGRAFGVAVDNDPSSPAFGDVYVVDGASKAVDVFDSSGTYLSQLTGTSSGAFQSVARDAVDPASGNLYMTAGKAIDEFSPTGVYMTKIEIPSGGQAASVAVNTTSGEVYADGVNKVDIFGPAVIIPDATVSVATGIQPTEAVLHGHVDPAGGGEITSCEFEYGTSPSYGETLPCSPAAPYSLPTDVSAGVSGLAPSSSYYYRLAVGNANGVAHSEEGTFETPGPPTIGEQSVVAVTRTTATLQAQMNPHGLETTYHFEYGPTAAYGTSVPIPDGNAGSGSTYEGVSAEITGLTLGGTYHYRLVATNSAGVVNGPDSTFATEPVANVENELWLADPHDVTLKAKVEDFGTPSECEVEYVSEAQFVSSGYASPTILLCTPQQLAGKQGELHTIARPKGLEANTTYHFRFLVSNQYGEERSEDQTFTTFGFAAFSFEDLGQEAHPYTQAGGHPYELRTNIELNTTTDQAGRVGPSGTVKDIKVHLPAGLIGNPQATQKCTRFESEQKRCSGAAQIGFVTVVLSEGSEADALFNLVPPHGVAAEFGVRFNKLSNAFIDGSVRTGTDYGLDADSLHITTLVPVVGVQVAIWGVPADPSHDQERNCGKNAMGYETPCSANVPLRPFLTNPTSCAGPLSASAQADAYQAPGEFAQLSAQVPAMTGCERLRFTPTIRVQPESSAADSPTGMHVDLHIPQEESPTGLAEADLKDASVSLPLGMTVNPSGASGLAGCSEAQIEVNGPAPAKCPDASKIGSVELSSPLVDHPLMGSVFVAQQGNAGTAQGSNRFGSLLALYIGIDDPQTGVVLKLAGSVKLDPVTGKLTATFDENPQLPFEDLKLDFFGGRRAALATAPTCGSYAASASLDSWAAPNTEVTPFVEPFTIGSGPEGAACAPPGFAPVLTAGTQSNRAGGFSPFTLSLTRNDGEQRLNTVSTTLPPGLAGLVSKVPECGEAQANAGTCSAASQIGHVTVADGVGSDPVVLPQSGEPQDPVYLTGPYEGAPFGLAFVVRAQAGPFDLGTEVVRARIMVDPHTARVTVVSDPIPTILQGVPLDVRRIDVTIDREGFVFNPTSCEPMQVDGMIGSTEGASANVSSRYQAAGCQTLSFKPSFKVSTQGSTSKKGGASLDVKVGSSSGQANIAKVHVTLPKQLPSRLDTLKLACRESVFAANPALCPVGSDVGTATAITPILSSRLTGPVYLVSHGGAAFPDLEVVLQGEGVTLILDGKTNIKNGITTSSFDTVPDAPIGSFELKLPEGQHSVLAAPGGKLCATKLAMPTTLQAQDGALIKRSTTITVTGCPRHKAKAHKTAKKGRSRAGH
jgi:hypothetical protein